MRRDVFNDDLQRCLIVASEDMCSYCEWATRRRGCCCRRYRCSRYRRRSSNGSSGGDDGDQDERFSFFLSYTEHNRAPCQPPIGGVYTFAPPGS